MIKLNSIANESECQNAIARLDELMDLEPAKNSNEDLGIIVPIL